MAEESSIHELAGLPASSEQLIDVSRHVAWYSTKVPNAEDPSKRVSFGTSGHRGNAENATFTESHILAITQAICDWRAEEGINGPLFLGMDTHALSAAAHATALEVLAANKVPVFIAQGGGFTPTPVISHAILTYNDDRDHRLADGIVITPSHNPPEDGGFKYNPPNGGPADTTITGAIQTIANTYLRFGNQGVRRTQRLDSVKEYDFVTPYVADLGAVINMERIRSAGVTIGVDPLGGASAAYWEPIAERYGLKLTVVNPAIDPTFRFMTLDHDGKIRMDCSSQYAMAGLLARPEKFDVAFGNDPDADRHGIIAEGVLMNPNHYLVVAIDYLLKHRPQWSKTSKVGKTVVSSNLIDRVVAELGRELLEVPVGFKWFAPGLFDGSVCFGGEESAGASFLRRNGKVWTTDKDGLILGLLAAEITARTGQTPVARYRQLEREFGQRHYKRIDTPADDATRAALKKLVPEHVQQKDLAGETIEECVIRAKAGDEIGGLVVRTKSAWMAARPSGTEPLYKLYAESCTGEAHLEQVIEDAQRLVNHAVRIIIQSGGSHGPALRPGSL